MGLGIMALPASVATLGWGPGLSALLAMFALNLYTGLLLWRLRVACPGAMSYTHLGAEVRGRVRVFGVVVGLGLGWESRREVL